MTRPGQDFVVVDVALVELARGRGKETVYWGNRFESVDSAAIHRRGHRWQLCAGLLHAGQPETSGLLQTRLPMP